MGIRDCWSCRRVVGFERWCVIGGHLSEYLPSSSFLTRPRVKQSRWRTNQRDLECRRRLGKKSTPLLTPYKPALCAPGLRMSLFTEKKTTSPRKFRLKSKKVKKASIRSTLRSWMAAYYLSCSLLCTRTALRRKSAKVIMRL